MRDVTLQTSDSPYDTTKIAAPYIRRRNSIRRENQRCQEHSFGIVSLKTAFCIATGFSQGGCQPAHPESIMSAWGGGVKVPFLRIFVFSSAMLGTGGVSGEGLREA